MQSQTEVKQAAFRVAYQAVLDKWPVAVEGRDIPTPFGVTHVNVCGPEGAPPLVLLPGGGLSSASWFANVGVWAEHHRVYALDLIGDVGLSVPSDTPPKGHGGLVAWMDSVLRVLNVSKAVLAGHSYGATIALAYARSAPSVVDKLVLVEPTKCFVGMNALYLLHAVPFVVRPGEQATRAFYRWETRGAALDDSLMTLITTPTGVPAAGIAWSTIPTAEDLRAVDMPTLVLVAERTRQHDIRKLATNARKRLSNVDVRTLVGATHHTIPSYQPQQLNREIADFL